MDAETAQQAQFDGWAIVEVFGHQKFAGRLTTQAFGQAVMFRVDVPELKERERTLKSKSYTAFRHSDGQTYEWLPAGSVVKDGAVQGYTKLFGASAIYCITPCTEEAAMAAVEAMQERPLQLVSIPADAQKAIAAGKDPSFEEDDDQYDDEEDDTEDDRD